MKKRLLGMLLAAALVLSMLPVEAHADAGMTESDPYIVELPEGKDLTMAELYVILVEVFGAEPFMCDENNEEHPGSACGGGNFYYYTDPNKSGKPVSVKSDDTSSSGVSEVIYTVTRCDGHKQIIGTQYMLTYIETRFIKFVYTEQTQDTKASVTLSKTGVGSVDGIENGEYDAGKVSFTVSPAAGYFVSSITINGAEQVAEDAFGPERSFTVELNIESGENYDIRVCMEEAGFVENSAVIKFVRFNGFKSAAEQLDELKKAIFDAALASSVPELGWDSAGLSYGFYPWYRNGETGEWIKGDVPCALNANVGDANIDGAAYDGYDFGERGSGIVHTVVISYAGDTRYPPMSMETDVTMVESREKASLGYDKPAEFEFDSEDEIIQAILDAVTTNSSGEITITRVSESLPANGDSATLSYTVCVGEDSDFLANEISITIDVRAKAEPIYVELVVEGTDGTLSIGGLSANGTLAAGEYVIIAEPATEAGYVASVTVNGTEIGDDISSYVDRVFSRGLSIENGESYEIVVRFEERAVSTGDAIVKVSGWLGKNGDDNSAVISGYLSALVPGKFGAVTSGEGGGELSMQMHFAKPEEAQDGGWYTVSALASSEDAGAAFEAPDASDTVEKTVRVMWAGDGQRYPTVYSQPVTATISELRPTVIIDTSGVTSVSNFNYASEIEAALEGNGGLGGMVKAYYTADGSNVESYVAIEISLGAVDGSASADGTVQNVSYFVSVPDTADYIGSSAAGSISVTGTVHNSKVELAETEGAEISVDASDLESVAPGNFTVTVAPDEGWYVDKIFVNGETKNVSWGEGRFATAEFIAENGDDESNIYIISAETVQRIFPVLEIKGEVQYQVDKSFEAQIDGLKKYIYDAVVNTKAASWPAINDIAVYVGDKLLGECSESDFTGDSISVRLLWKSENELKIPDVSTENIILKLSNNKQPSSIAIKEGGIAAMVVDGAVPSDEELGDHLKDYLVIVGDGELSFKAADGAAVPGQGEEGVIKVTVTVAEGRLYTGTSQVIELPVVGKKHSVGISVKENEDKAGAEEESKGEVVISGDPGEGYLEETVTITVSPEKGYYVQSVVIRDKEGNIVSQEPLDEADGYYGVPATDEDGVSAGKVYSGEFYAGFGTDYTIEVIYAEIKFELTEAMALSFRYGIDDAPDEENVYRTLIAEPEFVAAYLKQILYRARETLELEITFPETVLSDGKAIDVPEEYAGETVRLSLPEQWLPIGANISVTGLEEALEQALAEYCAPRVHSAEDGLLAIIAGKLAYYGCHDFGAEGATELVSISYEDEQKRICETMLLSLVDEREETAVSGASVSVRYGAYTMESLLSAIAPEVKAGEKVIEGAELTVTDISGMDVGSYEVTLSYAGDGEYKPSQATVIVKVEKAFAVVNVAEVSVDYTGEPVDIEITTQPDEIDYAALVVDENKNAVLLVPEAWTERRDVPIVIDGIMSAGDTAKAVMDELGLGKGKPTIGSALKLAFENAGEIVTLTINGALPSAEGSYRVSAVSAEPNYETVLDSALLTINHAMELVPAKAASCSGAGNNAYYACKNCGRIFKDAEGENETSLEAETVAALGHEWNTEDNAVVFVWDGSKVTNAYRVCERDDSHYLDASEIKVETETGCLSVKHTATATFEDGSAVVDYKYEPGSGHDPGEEWFFSASTHWHKCSECEAKLGEIVHSYGEADFSWTEEHSCTAKFKCVCGHEITLGCAVSSETTDASCTVDGKIVYTARVELDGKIYTSELTEIITASHSYEPKITSPTCTEQGYTTFICVCGESYVDEDSFVPAPGHSWGTDATFVWDGTVVERAYKLCDRDASHILEASEIKVEADIGCTSEKYTATASFSDGSSIVKYKYELGKGHTSETWEYDDSGHWQKCAVCGNKFDEASHSFEAEGICICGYEKEIEHSHSYGEPDFVWVDDFSSCKAVFKCQCQFELAMDCTITFKTTSATCTEDGEIVYTAMVELDGKAYSSERIETVPAGHVYEAVVTEPGCTEQGYTTYICVCGDSYVDEDSFVPAAGHSWGTDAEFVWDGGSVARAYKVCDRDKAHILDADEIKVEAEISCTYEKYTATASFADGSSAVSYKFEQGKGHSPGIWEYSDSTHWRECTKCGTKTVEAAHSHNAEGKCVCGHTIQIEEEHTHSYGEPFFNWAEDHKSCKAVFKCECGDGEIILSCDVAYKSTPANCTDDGEIVYTATVELGGKSYSSQQKIAVPASGHSWGEWTQTKAPTEYEDGEERRDCNNCDAYETNPIPALGHIHSYSAEITEANCTEEGYTAYICSCGDSYKADYTAALGHTGGEAVIENYTGATCAEDGGYDNVVYCSACGAELDRETIRIDALGHSYGPWLEYSDEQHCRVCANNAEHIEYAAHEHDGEGKCICGHEKEKIPGLPSMPETPSEPPKPSGTDKAVDPAACPDIYGYCPSQAYPDIDESLWYHQSIDFVIANGLMKGYDDGIFAPNDYTSRAMIITIIYRISGEPESGADIVFDDISAEAYYANAVKWGTENGIILGYGNGCFGPDELITREQLASIIWRYAKYLGVDIDASDEYEDFDYADKDNIAPYAVDALKWASHAGIIEGFGDGRLLPQDKASRAQTAAMIARFCELVGWSAE